MHSFIHSFIHSSLLFVRLLLKNVCLFVFTLSLKLFFLCLFLLYLYAFPCSSILFSILFPFPFSFFFLSLTWVNHACWRGVNHQQTTFLPSVFLSVCSLLFCLFVRLSFFNSSVFCLSFLLSSLLSFFSTCLNQAVFSWAPVSLIRGNRICSTTAVNVKCRQAPTWLSQRSITAFALLDERYLTLFPRHKDTRIDAKISNPSNFVCYIVYPGRFILKDACKPTELTITPTPLSPAPPPPLLSFFHCSTV